MSASSNDPDIESAKREIARDPSEDSADDGPTVEEEGVMTPDQDTVEDANASGVNPEK